MMRSLFAGVAGLKTHQIKMDVIGNNIANVNTVGYKSQSINFAELMYQTTQNASGPNADTGRAGTNAKQIGLGTVSAAITTNMSAQGSSQNTGNAFDLRISGDAFFIVNGGSGNMFTRDGSFYVDAMGNLAMSSNGYNVMGWQVDENGDIVQDNVSKLQILKAENMTSAPQVTSRANMTGIIDKMDPQVMGDGKVVNLQIYDNLGYSYTARFLIQSTDDEGMYTVTLDDLRDANNDSVIKDTTKKDGTVIKAKYDANIFTGTGFERKDPPTYTNPIARAKTYTLSDRWTIGADGQTLVNKADPSITLDPTKAEDQEKYADAWGCTEGWEKFSNLYQGEGDTKTKITTNLAGAIDKDSGTLKVDGYYAEDGKVLTLSYDQISGALQGIDGLKNDYKNFFLNIEPLEAGADNPFSMNSAQGEDQGKPGIAVFMDQTTNVNNEKKSTIGALSGDADGFGTGWAVGAMTGVSIQGDGKIYGAYDNGQTKLLGQIAVAKFANATGLEKMGENLYAATLNSGQFDGVGVDVSADGGKVSTGILEMSNVDLSTEFTELITTQRGFQANSRIITVSDTLLEELVNLKR